MLDSAVNSTVYLCFEAEKCKMYTWAFFFNNNIFLGLTVELAGKYALVGILCLLRHVRWYVGN